MTVFLGHVPPLSSPSPLPPLPSPSPLSPPPLPSPSAMGGNIIPAIATTNAVIDGVIVMEGLKVLAGEFTKCRTVSTP